MTTSEELVTVAIWMMIIGGAVSFFGLWTIFQSTVDVNRGDLAKPLTIVGMCLFLVGGFLKYQWGTHW
jgi:hypothetical protein